MSVGGRCSGDSTPPRAQSIWRTAADSMRPSAAPAQQPPASHASPPEPKWGPAPAIFPAGAQMEVLQGDPGGANMFTVRLRFPEGYRIAPHTHPTDEHVNVNPADTPNAGGSR